MEHFYKALTSEVKMKRYPRNLIFREADRQMENRLC